MRGFRLAGLVWADFGVRGGKVFVGVVCVMWLYGYIYLSAFNRETTVSNSRGACVGPLNRSVGVNA